ncbi:MAG: metallophosphoesterase [Proteobacteria bacterium]|nr:metallophosphoesterase [Pseudomonadota bacterium]
MSCRYPLALVLLALGCTKTPENPESVDDGITRFAVIGDYGLGTPGAMSVAERIESWGVDFIITLGDNNYPEGSASTIDGNIGAMYSEWIYPYTGEHTPGTSPNKFFPTLGNHDWKTPGVTPYLEYFTLPGNERYYDVEWGNVHLFALDSDSAEPDGITEDSVQGQWFAKKAAASTAPFQVAYFHHPPYSRDRETVEMRWDWEGAGVDVVLTGHEHWYERFEVDGFPYVINGLGGALWDSIPEPAPKDSVISFSGALGAMLVEASETEMTLTMITAAGEEVDQFTVTP